MKLDKWRRSRSLCLDLSEMTCMSMKDTVVVFFPRRCNVGTVFKSGCGLMGM